MRYILLAIGMFAIWTMAACGNHKNEDHAQPSGEPEVSVPALVASDAVFKIDAFVAANQKNFVEANAEGYVFSDKSTNRYQALSVGTFAPARDGQKFKLCAELSAADAIPALRINGADFQLTAVVDINNREIAMKPKRADGNVSMDGDEACLVTAVLPAKIDFEVYIFPAIGNTLEAYDKTAVGQVSIVRLTTAFEDP